jgi:hypothetical protein
MVWAAVGVSGMIAWWQYYSVGYSASISTVNATGGMFSGPSGMSFSIEGYEVTRGDRTANRPRLLCQFAAPGSLTYLMTAVGGPAARQQFVNITVDGASTNNVGGFNLSNVRASATQCVAQNFNGTGGIGFNASNTGIQGISCQANTCGTGFNGGGSGWLYCDAVSCTTGFASGSNHNNCLARQCTNGFSSGTVGICFVNCTADSNTTAGFVTTQAVFYEGCIATNTLGGGGVGFNVASLQATMTNCASYNNVTEISGTPLANDGMIYSASFTGGQPYTTAGTDFRPNATAGSGMLLRGAGIGVYGQTDNVDIGAVQHSDPTGGGGAAANLSRVFSGF